MSGVATAGHNILNPLEHQDFFNVHSLVNVKSLFDVRAHLGHKSGCTNEFMRPYIFGSRLNVDIVNLGKTVPLFQDALNFAAHIAYLEGIIMFVTRHKQTIPLVERTAKDCQEFSHCRLWKGGTFTNATIQYGLMSRLPDLCIFLNTHGNALRLHTAVTECAKMNIPTIGIVDTNSDPRLITYPVPANDDTPVAIEYYCNAFKNAILKGKSKRQHDTQNITAS